MSSILTMPPPPPPPPPPPAPAVTRPKIVPKQFKLNALVAPVTIPQKVVINAVPDTPSPAATTAGVPGGVPGGIAGGTLGGILGSIKVAGPPPPPPPPPAPAAAPPTPSRIQVGGQVQAAKIVHQVLPTYPKLAHEAHVAGTVRLKAVIAADGTVKDLSVISGHPLLIDSALNAVKQWVYKPTILNGVPIEVDTEIDVNFQLSST